MIVARSVRFSRISRFVFAGFLLQACASSELIDAVVDADTGGSDDDTGGGRPDTGGDDVAPVDASDAADVGDEVDAVADVNDTDDGGAETTDSSMDGLGDTSSDVVDEPDVADVAPDLPPGVVSCTPAQAAVICGDPTLCVDGVCCDTACVGACNACNLPGLEGTCSPRPSDAVCRESAGACDSPEFCDGTNIGCGPDRLEVSGVVCRPAADACDVPETCSGFVATCPPDTFAGAGNPCGDPSDTECDNPDSCDGAGRCVSNAEPTTVECSEATEECLLPARCDGEGACSGGGLAPVGTPCGSAESTSCDAPDSCNSAGQCVPNYRSVGTACGSGADSICDNPDRCDGAGTCQPNFEVAGAPCGDPTSNACTEADSCDGAGACAANHDPAGTACGDPSVTTCDLADSCNGSGLCATNPAPPTTICRAVAGVCDAAEFCDGAGACPPDRGAAVATPCGDATADTCTAPDSCDAAGACVPNHAVDGIACGFGDAEYRCGGGEGCDARPQARTVTRACTSGACIATGVTEWGDLAVCAPNAICTATATSASCATCSSAPAGYCESGSAYNFTNAGACAAGACSYPVVAEACAGSCTTSGTVASCASCNEALMAIPNAPLWTWDSGDQGWNMGGDWGRTTGSRRNGSHGIDTNSVLFEYEDNASERNQWTASYDLTRCATCPMSAGFWLRGFTEDNYDGVTLQCSGNGGSSWTSVGDRIDGYYSSWTFFSRVLPASCLTSTMRIALLFTSDSSVVDDGYFIDDFRLFTTNTAPNGYLDTANGTGVGGWACDGDAWSDEISVRLRFFRNGTGTAIVRTVRASDLRADLASAGVCGGTGNHGYTFNYDAELLAALGAGTHTVRAYGVDGPAPCGAGEYELTLSPLTFTR